MHSHISHIAYRLNLFAFNAVPPWKFAQKVSVVSAGLIHKHYYLLLQLRYGSLWPRKRFASSESPRRQTHRRNPQRCRDHTAQGPSSVHTGRAVSRARQNIISQVREIRVELIRRRNMVRRVHICGIPAIFIAHT